MMKALSSSYFRGGTVKLFLAMILLLNNFAHGPVHNSPNPGPLGSCGQLMARCRVRLRRGGNLHPSQYQVCPELLGSVMEPLQGIGVELIIPIQEGQILTPCLHNSTVTGSSHTLVILVYAPNMGMFFTVLVHDLLGAVDGSVVDYDHLVVCETLLEQ